MGLMCESVREREKKKKKKKKKKEWEEVNKRACLHFLSLHTSLSSWTLCAPFPLVCENAQYS